MEAGGRIGSLVASSPVVVAARRAIVQTEADQADARTRWLQAKVDLDECVAPAASVEYRALDAAHQAAHAHNEAARAATSIAKSQRWQAEQNTQTILWEFEHDRLVNDAELQAVRGEKARRKQAERERKVREQAADDFLSAVDHTWRRRG